MPPKKKQKTMSYMLSNATCRNDEGYSQPTHSIDQPINALEERESAPKTNNKLQYYKKIWQQQYQTVGSNDIPTPHTEKNNVNDSLVDLSHTHSKDTDMVLDLSNKNYEKAEGSAHTTSNAARNIGQKQSENLHLSLKTYNKQTKLDNYKAVCGTDNIIIEPVTKIDSIANDSNRSCTTNTKAAITTHGTSMHQPLSTVPNLLECSQHISRRCKPQNSLLQQLLNSNPFVDNITRDTFKTFLASDDEDLTPNTQEQRSDPLTFPVSAVYNTKVARVTAVVGSNRASPHYRAVQKPGACYQWAKTSSHSKFLPGSTNNTLAEHHKQSKTGTPTTNIIQNYYQGTNHYLAQHEGTPYDHAPNTVISTPSITTIKHPQNKNWDCHPQ